MKVKVVYSLDQKERKKIIYRNARKPSKEELIKLSNLKIKEISEKLQMSQTKVRLLFKNYNIKRNSKKKNEDLKNYMIDFKINKFENKNSEKNNFKSVEFNNFKIEENKLPSVNEILNNLNFNFNFVNISTKFM
jgi:hypothetical protein